MLIEQIEGTDTKAFLNNLVSERWKTFSVVDTFQVANNSHVMIVRVLFLFLDNMGESLIYFTKQADEHCNYLLSFKFFLFVESIYGFGFKQSPLLKQQFLNTLNEYHTFRHMVFDCLRNKRYLVGKYQIF